MQELLNENENILDGFIFKNNHKLGGEHLSMSEEPEVSGANLCLLWRNQIGTPKSTSGAPHHPSTLWFWSQVAWSQSVRALLQFNYWWAWRGNTCSKELYFNMVIDEYNRETFAHNLTVNTEKRLFTCMHSNLSK